RRRRGFELLGKGKFKAKDPLPFCFTPKKKPKPADLFRVLRDHYEGTNNDLSDGYKNGSPNSTKKRTICTEATRYSFVANLRPDLPEEIAYCIWIAFRRPDSNAYSPWYVSIPSPPEGYTFDSILSPLKLHFHQPAGFFKETTEYAYWYFAKLSRLVDLDYKKRRKEAWKEWKNFEDYTLKRLKKIEKEFVHMLKNNKNIAMKIITNHVHKLEYRKWFLAQTLIRKFEKKK
ncbi:MAG: hypothetical protein GY757_36890, partial [bacterium]|nr:hypothetical protein [bacterium]